MKTWYTITAKADKPETAEISIYDEIGMWGVTAAAFIADLKKIGDVKNILLTVNSPGGSVFDGLAIYNALSAVRNKGVNITAKVMGIAASAASFIVMAANKVEMPENAMMMVHYASGLAWGNAEDMRETADILDKIDASLVGIYAARTGKDEAAVRELLKAETYMTAAEAKEHGFADAVTENVKATASFEIDRLPANVQALFKQGQGTPLAAEANGLGNFVEAVTPLAAAIKAAAEANGLGDFADTFALNFDTIEAATDAIIGAVEIKALCEVAKRPGDAAGFIRNSTPLADVRKSLCNVLATQDERTHTDTAPKNGSSSGQGVQPKAKKTADIYAARRKSVTH